jgi:hypothetical protein
MIEQNNLSATEIIQDNCLKISAKSIGKVEKIWFNDTVRFYRKNNLVYAPVLKNASTFYTTLFTKNNWKLIQFQDIDWDKDRVFGFIQNPTIRYCKGLTEDLYNDNDLQLHILPLLEQRQKNVLPMTFHTLPISLMFGDYMYDILWIPIDKESLGKEKVVSFLKINNISLNWDNHQSKIHESNLEKLKFFETVKNMLGNGNSNFWKLLSKDIDLYYHVINTQ